MPPSPSTPPSADHSTPTPVGDQNGTSPTRESAAASAQSDLVTPDEVEQVPREISAEHFEQMQRHLIWGLGSIAVTALLSLVVMVIIRPELANLAATIGQVIFSGLLGIGGSITGYLFLRNSARRREK